jgi:hypothetical protein
MNWADKLLLPLATLAVNAAMTYGVISTQLQWLRHDLDRQQTQIERIQDVLNDRAHSMKGG